MPSEIRWILSSVFSLKAIIRDCTELRRHLCTRAAWYCRWLPAAPTFQVLASSSLTLCHENMKVDTKKSLTLCTHYFDKNLFQSLTLLMAMPPANFCCKCIHRQDMPTGSVSTLSLSLRNCSPASVYLSDPLQRQSFPCSSLFSLAKHSWLF